VEKVCYNQGTLIKLGEKRGGGNARDRGETRKIEKDKKSE
jgi:hypothetical protein